ncbi:hypothetical protein [Desulfonatronum parangueonense]
MQFATAQQIFIMQGVHLGIYVFLLREAAKFSLSFWLNRNQFIRYKLLVTIQAVFRIVSIFRHRNSFVDFVTSNHCSHNPHPALRAFDNGSMNESRLRQRGGAENRTNPEHFSPTPDSAE